MRRMALLGIAVLAVALSLALAGCDKEPSTGFGADIPLREPLTQSELVVGTPSDGAQVVTVCNRTGQAVTTVELKLATEQDYSEPSVSQAWKNEQVLRLYLPKVQSAPSEEGPLLYDARLTLADGTVFGITGFDISAMTDATLRIDARAGLAYLESVNVLGATTSTLGSSKAAKAAAEEAQRLAEELAQAAAAEAAELEAQANTNPNPNPNTGYGYGADSGVGSGSGGVTQTDDGCLDDTIIN
jgi:predicted small secreted protein